jgi:hypothetical protein
MIETRDLKVARGADLPALQIGYGEDGCTIP